MPRDLLKAGVNDLGIISPTANLQNMQSLPGPTGEMNARSTVAKPAIICAGPGAQATAAQAKEVTDLGRIALCATGLIDPDDLQDTGPIGGVIWWGDPATARRFDRALAARDGPLIALIIGTPDAAHVVFERHVCIDTTAAGGNADLLRDTG